MEIYKRAIGRLGIIFDYADYVDFLTVRLEKTKAELVTLKAELERKETYRCCQCGYAGTVNEKRLCPVCAATEFKAMNNSSGINEMRLEILELREYCQDLAHETKIAQAAVAKAEGEIQVLSKGIIAVRDLIKNSQGVIGLHLNGDVANWGTLEQGGMFESWLIDFNEAESICELIEVCDEKA
jgi:hypothetical protein